MSKPGSEGTDFRLHVNVELPSRRFAEAELTDAHGGESFERFTIEPGDLMVGDRAYGTTNGIRHVVLHGGYVLVRTNGSSLPLMDEAGASDPSPGLEVARRSFCHSYSRALRFSITSGSMLRSGPISRFG